MIQINLLKKDEKPLKQEKKSRFNLDSKQVKIVLAVALILPVIAVLGWQVYDNYIFTPEIEKKILDLETYESTMDTEIEPETIEEIVKDYHKSDNAIIEDGLLKMPYANLSFIEKMNYQIHFAKNICNTLTAVTRSSSENGTGIGFSTVLADSFSIFEGTGVCKTKETFNNLILTLRQKGVAIKPNPHSFVKKESNYFAFKVVCLPEFGYDTKAPLVVSPDDIPEKDDIQFIFKQFRSIAEDHEILLDEEVEIQTREFNEAYRKTLINISGQTTWGDFVLFTNSLVTRKVPIAFNFFTLKAAEEGRLILNAELQCITQD